MQFSHDIKCVLELIGKLLPAGAPAGVALDFCVFLPHGGSLGISDPDASDFSFLVKKSVALRKIIFIIRDMDANELKSKLAKHFDFAPHGTGQYFSGEWFTPKHQSSLEDFIGEIILPLENKVEEFETALENCKEDLKGKDEIIEELNVELAESKK